jgi:hypothetical protein
MYVQDVNARRLRPKLSRRAPTRAVYTVTRRQVPLRETQRPGCRASLSDNAEARAVYANPHAWQMSSRSAGRDLCKCNVNYHVRASQPGARRLQIEC